MVQEVEWSYFGIPDYILDGIHPEEDMDGLEDRVEVDQADTTKLYGGKLYGGKNDTNGTELKLNQSTKHHNEKICGNDEPNSLKMNRVTQVLLSYANHHISSIFIIVLSISSLIMSMHVSIGITAVIVIFIVAIDIHFSVGLRTIL